MNQRRRRRKRTKHLERLESANRRKTPEPLVNTCRLASLCPMTCFDVNCMFCLVVFVYCLHTKSGHVNVKGPARTLRWARGHLCSNLVQWCTRALHQSAALSSCRAVQRSHRCSATVEACQLVCCQGLVTTPSCWWCTPWESQAIDQVHGVGSATLLCYQRPCMRRDLLWEPMGCNVVMFVSGVAVALLCAEVDDSMQTVA